MHTYNTHSIMADKDEGKSSSQARFKLLQHEAKTDSLENVH